MGHKVNPISLRVAVNKNWRSRWYGDKRVFADFFHEDLKIRALVKKTLENAAVADVLIERYANRVRVTIRTARPGIALGRRGQEGEKLRESLAKLTGKDVYVDVREIKYADLNAQLAAENVALQLERRVSFRRAMKKAIQSAMSLGAQGVKVTVGGRLGGAELARQESYKEGKTPLHTLRAFIDYGFAEAHTVAGKVGVKVWICRKPEEESEAKAVGGRRAANA